MLRRLLILLSFCLVLGACTKTSTSTSTTAPPAESTTTGQTAPETTRPAQTETTQLPDSTWSELPGISDLPIEVQDELLALVRQTEEIRQLRFEEPPVISVVTDAELEKRVRDLIADDLSDLPADEALYKLLGLLDPEADLETLLLDVYGEQVAGFYDGEAGELVVPMRVDGFTITQKSTLIHELTHALTDEHFHFEPVVRQLFDDDRLDELSAYQALAEGDASYAEFLYLQTLSQREIGQFIAEALSIDTSTLTSSPQFIQDSLLFPYDAGLAFVQRLHGTGGWAAVNEAYAEMPGLPGSTEQIITPSDYQRDLPIPVDLSEITLPGYTLERVSVWGELGFRIMIDQVLGESVGVDAADGWGGDIYYQWFDGRNAAIVIAYRGDTPRDMDELDDALVDYAFSAVPEEDFVWVEVIGGQLYFIAADEPAVGQSILTAIGG